MCITDALSSRLRIRRDFRQGMDKKELAGLLSCLPPIEFCCAYGSSLNPNNNDKTRMIDYIIGARDPVEWHSENLKLNSDRYASWIRHLGGGKLVCILVDIVDVEGFNSYNLKASVSAALLMLAEEDLYTKICSLSYMGDLRMLFAEDKYKGCDLRSAQSLIPHLPPIIRSKMGVGPMKQQTAGSGRMISESVIRSTRGDVASSLQTVLRCKVMTSSMRQAVSGFLTTSSVRASRYLPNKLRKAWNSWD
ncbi:Phosphatidate cytidylyltransferase, mitochondrial-like protein [Drosera capensis]